MLGTTSLFSQQVIKSFSAPGPGTRGLAWDGKDLWVADSRMDSLYKIEMDSGSVLVSLYFPLNDTFGGIGYGSDSLLWIGNEDSVYAVDPHTGAVINAMMAPGC
jgi:hypothetical protein